MYVCAIVTVRNALLWGVSHEAMEVICMRNLPYHYFSTILIYVSHTPGEKVMMILCIFS